ncbi:MAG: type II toxin-antitoxin system HicB family antitoxin [Aerococcus suis]|nr:type II toxin-antitoxin system HicB family antitoxin [Aerococcus suis]
MLVYPAVFEKTDESYIVRFPDIPEAMTEGDTLNQSYEMAVEVLGLALEDYTEFPSPSDVEEIKKDYPDSLVTLIGIDLVAYRRKYHSKSIRKNVTVPEWLADIAQSENINFSQTLTEALKDKLSV